MLKFSIFEFIVSLFPFVFFALGIYGFVLFVKLCNRGIKAFDIYIAEKTNNDMKDKR
ncbi:hypothetical protein [Clostridium fungisolvens]|uniref:Uncharacterized protein n=1 Tax=Clostridium fungisolvens TaxID=1604897 RepID=A0A6V8SFY7_9CLOT|nr:hypothetical protein [Clostridium fungisolvens]GFP75701.1 hypothetical protein bsdtw1_01792 [Clostridium fungisolvens]